MKSVMKFFWKEEDGTGGQAREVTKNLKLNGWPKEKRHTSMVEGKEARKRSVS
jgi:hypothetical protein